MNSLKNRQPDCWPSWLQISLALLCALPPIVLLELDQNLWTLVAAGAGLGFWLWLGWNTRGFPFLFDFLSLHVLLISIITGVAAAIRIYKAW